MATAFDTLPLVQSQPSHLPPGGRSISGAQHRRHLFASMAAAGGIAATGATAIAGAPVAATDPNAELIAVAKSYLRVLAEWEAAPREPDRERCEARTASIRDRADLLRDRLAELEAATLPGLAMVMRIEFADQCMLTWAAAAMLRGRPTAEELEETLSEQHMLWLFIENLERIAGTERLGRA